MNFPRASGILLHPTSLPGQLGIGDLGPSAYEFVDFLAASGQTLWQVLPLGPTGYDHSPYTMNFSTFAGNPLLISLEELVRDGFLTQAELASAAIDLHPTLERVNFTQVIPQKMNLLQRAFRQFLAGLTARQQQEFDQFCLAQADWLEDYVLFMGLLEANSGQSWHLWERAIAVREPLALEAETQRLQEQLAFHRFLQFKFYQQWSHLRTYANAQGIRIIGDISIYVCHNSADVWTHPDLFKLDPATLEPAYVAGVPPDYFSATGQLWGNPVYNWERLEKTNFHWWIQRFRVTLNYVDLVRVDHFRGFEAYWEIPAGEETAIKGQWIKAPGAALFETVEQTLGPLPILAEDLGIITPEVEALRDRFGFPGMRILQFGFDEGPDDPYLPHHYPQNCVVYTGTHDNNTTLGWWQSSPPEVKQFLAKYLGLDTPMAIAEIHWLLIRVALASVANLAIFPLQDLLGLEAGARMNDPSQVAGTGAGVMKAPKSCRLP